MEFVSIEKSRAGYQPGTSKKSAAKAAPKTSVDSTASKTKPDDGTSVSKHEED